MSIVIINHLVREDRKFPHLHKWVSLEDHPRGGDVSACFMMEKEERDTVEMCLNCYARRIKATLLRRIINWWKRWKRRNVSRLGIDRWYNKWYFWWETWFLAIYGSFLLYMFIYMTINSPAK